MTVNLLMAMIFSIGIVSKRPAVSNYQNSYLTPNLREIKQKKLNYSSLNLNAISSVLFPSASEPSMNFDNIKLAY